MKNVIEIVRNVDQLMIPENFVGIGSTRKVFRFKHWVIKKHLHRLVIYKVKMSKKFIKHYKR
ncbi:hypothetical protein ACVWXS_004262 [Lysinibacillus sp. TE18511]